jgi:hypothetical protein
MKLSSFPAPAPRGDGGRPCPDRVGPHIGYPTNQTRFAAFEAHRSDSVSPSPGRRRLIKVERGKLVEPLFPPDRGLALRPSPMSVEGHETAALDIGGSGSPRPDRDPMSGSRRSVRGSRILRPGNPTLPPIPSRSPPSVRHDCKLRSSQFHSEPRDPAHSHTAPTRRDGEPDALAEGDEGPKPLEAFMPFHHDRCRPISPSSLESIRQSPVGHRLQQIDRKRHHSMNLGGRHRILETGTVR